MFLKVAEQARRDPDNTYIIVIDEFSRGDPSRIFGELLTYIEVDYRNKKFILPYSGRSRSIPKNVIILGTMNPYDKSVSDLDAAMERRFEIIALEPNVEILKTLVSTAGMDPELLGKVVEFFVDANKKCPHGFGHTYFLGVKDNNDLKRLWNHKLRFTFEKIFRFEQHVYQDLKNAYSKLVDNPDDLV
jgi:5-methylcytosine-specific restriction protein B